MQVTVLINMGGVVVDSSKVCVQQQMAAPGEVRTGRCIDRSPRRFCSTLPSVQTETGKCEHLDILEALRSS